MNVARYKEYAENELLCNSAIDMLYGVVVEETKTPFGLAE
jgi:hypothetical protein